MQVESYDVAYDEAFVYSVLDATEKRSGAQIDLSGYTVRFVDSEHPCKNPKAFACGSVDHQEIIIGSVAPAYQLAHELGYIWFDQSEGDSDHDHKHQEWFAPDVGHVAWDVGLSLGR